MMEEWKNGNLERLLISMTTMGHNSSEGVPLTQYSNIPIFHVRTDDFIQPGGHYFLSCITKMEYSHHQRRWISNSNQNKHLSYGYK